MTREEAILANLMTVLDREHAEAVIEHRNITIKKKLTPLAAKLLAKRFAEWGDANEAAEIMIEQCWQGFKPEWVKDRPMPATVGDEGDLAAIASQSEFDELVEAYPVLGSYTDALKAFDAAKKAGENIGLIIQAAKWEAASLPSVGTPEHKEAVRFKPSLHRWISERRYMAKAKLYAQMVGRGQKRA